MVRCLPVWWVCLLALVGGQALANPSALRRSVFRIETISQDRNFVNPWRLRSPDMSSGSGFFIGDGRILTNAHVVSNASSIMVQRDGDARKVPAFVMYIGHDVDLAVLGVLDDKYFKDVEPLPLGSVPKLRSPVTTVGFPMGGDQISMTDGVVNRISYRTYVHTDAHEHLLVQVDSAINPGNSGGPVFQGRQVVGVAFQALTRAQSAGFIIPVPVVQRFLNDCLDGFYDGVPEWGVETQELLLNNSATARFYRVDNGERRGVVVSRVHEWSPAKGVLQRGDVLLSISGKKIGVDGKISFEGERVDFEVLYGLRLKGDAVRFQISRDGAVQEVLVKAGLGKPHQYSGRIYAKRPKYSVFGGIVFTALTRSVMELWGDAWEKRAPLLLRYMMREPFEIEGVAEREELVIISDVLVNAANSFVVIGSPVVDKINGKTVTSVRMVHELLNTMVEDTLRIDFMFDDDPWILSARQLRVVHEETNQRYGVTPTFWLEPYSVDAAISKDEMK
jgi:S1-C subfamily serine protease